MVFNVGRSSVYQDGQPVPQMCGGATTTDGGVTWQVDLPDLAALLAFVDREGCKVIVYPGGGALEIYDGWRE